MRKIDEVLRFRTDLSPFLVHLTRNHREMTAQQCLEEIITRKKLFQGSLELHDNDYSMSDARYAVSQLDDEQRRKFFGFISFTETPLSEIYCLLDIEKRKIKLEPYGLVFLKDRLKKRNVSPVFYLNNARGDKDPVVRALSTLIREHPKEAEQILPLVAIFGKKLTPPGAATQMGEVDFTWEREWRLPFVESLMLNFNEDDVFVGLCPDSERREFERLFPPVEFIDPRLNAKHYAAQLIGARKRLELKHSVV